MCGSALHDEPPTLPLLQWQPDGELLALQHLAREPDAQSPQFREAVKLCDIGELCKAGLFLREVPHQQHSDYVAYRVALGEYLDRYPLYANSDNRIHTVKSPAEVGRALQLLYSASAGSLFRGDTARS